MRESLDSEVDSQPLDSGAQPCLFFHKVLSECSLKVFQAGTTRRSFSSVIKPLDVQIYVHKILLVSCLDSLHGIGDKKAFSCPAIDCLRTKQPLCKQATCSESHGNGTPAISVTNNGCGQKHGEAIVSPATLVSMAIVPLNIQTKHRYVHTRSYTYTYVHT